MAESITDRRELYATYGSCLWCFGPLNAIMEAREQHARWLADQIPDGAVLHGRAYKPGVDLTDGSPALLLAAILREQGKTFVHADDPTPGTFNVVCVAEPRYRTVVWPDGSTVLDPFGIVPDQPGVTVRRIGRP